MIFSKQQLASAGVTLAHHFGDDGSGVYIKETFIPRGATLPMHEHTFTHKAVLASGQARVTSADLHGASNQLLRAPSVLVMRQGVQHAVEALTDVVWLCIHATDETDPERIDMTLVEHA